MITKKDSNILFNYIIKTTGYPAKKVYTMLADYIAILKNCNWHLSVEDDSNFKNKWHITDQTVMYNILALVIGTETSKHVFTTPDGNGRRNIHIE